jgi:hypothetical protein
MAGFFCALPVSLVNFGSSELPPVRSCELLAWPKLQLWYFGLVGLLAAGFLPAAVRISARMHPELGNSA